MAHAGKKRARKSPARKSREKNAGTKKSARAVPAENAGNGDATSQLEMVDSSELLPDCVKPVLTAADQLYDLIFRTPFPDLDQVPPDSVSILEAAELAKEWGWRVLHAHGDDDVIPKTPGQATGGVLRLLKPRGVGGGRSRHVAHAAEVFGPVPDNLRNSHGDSFKYIFSISPGRRTLMEGNSLKDPAQREPDFIPENWAEISQRLRQCQLVVLTNALGLVRWVRGRVREMEEAVMPEVRSVAELSHGALQVEVRLAGGCDRRRIQRAMHHFLWNLAERGQAKATRTTKANLLAVLPELRHWIRSGGRSASTIETEESIYTIPDRLRTCINLPKP